jgi:hypothetical protein
MVGKFNSIPETVSAQEAVTEVLRFGESYTERYVVAPVTRRIIRKLSHNCVPA